MLLDDQCGIGDRGKDENYAQSIHKKFEGNRYFAKPSVKLGGDLAFIVKHYADDVIYQVMSYGVM